MTNRKLVVNAATVVVSGGEGLQLLSVKLRGKADDWERAPLSGNISAAFDTNLWEMYGHFCNDRKAGCDKTL